MDCSLPGSSVHGILQARILEWVAMLSSRGVFLTQGLNLHLLSPALAARFFTISVPWEALSISIDLTILDFQYKMNHIICGVLYLVCFSYHIFLGLSMLWHVLVLHSFFVLSCV